MNISKGRRSYLILGIINRIKVNMYVDDTTIYLLKEDKYSDLKEILDDWCTASGTKFNMEKTEVLPIGTKMHREQVVLQRKLNELDEPWPESVCIAKDGNPICTLGAWVRNKVEQATSWELVLQKIETHLKRWSLCHPSLDGKRLIIQMLIGRMTQFLTKAQGMPKSIEATITKKI
ncbi:hypothetical protein BDR05DRAFT_978714 [Suillus weaverae]|nr:hypothetical protein BDR05DRAFT_978714 [Suillus weaverae]